MSDPQAGEIRWDLVESHLGLARARAARFSRAFPGEWETYYDAAVDGLICASRQSVRGEGEFVRLASVVVEGKMVDALRRRTSLRRRPRTRTLRLDRRGASGEPLEVPAPAGPETDSTLEEMIGWLPEREATALLHHFRGGLNRREVGRAMGLQEWTAERAIRSGIDRLARRMGGRSETGSCRPRREELT